MELSSNQKNKDLGVFNNELIKLPKVQKNIAIWIEALRSGNFNQGSGKLFSPLTTGYCCLGVANEVCNLGVEVDDSYLSDPASQKMGLMNSSGGGEGAEGQYDNYLLARWNDTDVKFTEIAEFLEDQYNFITN